MYTTHLLFLHHDIYLKDPKFLEKIIQLLTKNPNDIFGVAGMTSEGRVVSNLRYKDDDSFITRMQLPQITNALSLDECCFAMTYDLWNKTRFDEYVCNHWHLYSVEFCYNAMRLHKSQSFVVPYDVYHKNNSGSGLYSDNHFLKSMWRMTRKYKNIVDTIYAPCYIITTSFLPALLRISRTVLANTKRGFSKK